MAEKTRLSLTILYSEGSNTEHSNSEPIRKPNVLLFPFRMVRNSNGRSQQSSIAIERTIRNPNYGQPRSFNRYVNKFFLYKTTQASHSFDKMAAILFYHSKTEHHSKSELRRPSEIRTCSVLEPPLYMLQFRDL